VGIEIRKNVIRFFRGLSLRQRFLVAPLLGVVVCSLLTAAFVYESQRQNALLGRLTERDFLAFDRYAEVFVNLTEQHTALYDLLYSAGKIDEATLYDQAKHHLYGVQQAIQELEEALPAIDKSVAPDFATLRNELSANAQAYRKGVGAAVGMATVNVALAPNQLAVANERFTAMNRSFVRLLDLERQGNSFEITARVHQSQINSTTIAFIGVSIAALLFFLSLVLSRILARSIETQVGILTDLGIQAGAHLVVDGSDEVARMAQAIAAFRQSLLELRESERRFSDLLGNVELVSVMVDRESRITYCNEYLLQLTGYRREEVIGRDWFERFIREPSIPKANFAALLADKPEARHRESGIFTRSGECRLIRWNNSVLRSTGGDVIGTASIGEDITEQKRAEIGIKRLNRVYAVLSGINTLILRVRDRDELFREACRIAVESGQFPLAWVAVADPRDERVKAVAWAGDERGFVQLTRPTVAAKGQGKPGLGAQAMAKRSPVVCNDIESDGSAMRYPEGALERGYRSAAALPLVVDDTAIGALVLYAAEAGFFDDQEIQLLQELAGDISFAINHIDKQERLDYLAYYDVLTGLANRNLFLERLAQYMRSAVSNGHKLALYIIDLERFKNINDSLGQVAGDTLLKQVAEWLTRSVGDANLLARVSADHFALVLPEVKQEGDVARLLEKTIESFLEYPFQVDDAVLRIAAKFGVALFPDDGADADTLFKNAEAALKKAKASGDRYLFYTQKMTATVAGKLTMENQLRQALDKEEFVLHYQPKVDLLSGKLTGAEALIRWNDPRTGLIPPGRFIPILEETGLIFEVGRWALRKAIEDYLRWRAAGLAAVRIAVNVSPLQLRHRGFIAEIEQAIGIDAHAAAGLELEITENMIMEDVKQSIASLQAIRAMGITIAIDDFGTGFSSLSYLSKLPVDTLKIDRSFVTDMTAGPEGLALVSTIINLAHSLKLNVVAEGVETEEQSRLLRLLRCDEMQGFLFSKPVPSDIFEATFLTPPRSAPSLAPLPMRERPILDALTES
jgi:diguanylate cyclase (GGDEF)-like protein/PAS domain S-box-containing protein